MSMPGIHQTFPMPYNVIQMPPQQYHQHPLPVIKPVGRRVVDTLTTLNKDSNTLGLIGSNKALWGAVTMLSAPHARVFQRLAVKGLGKIYRPLAIKVGRTPLPVVKMMFLASGALSIFAGTVNSAYAMIKGFKGQ